MREVLLHFIWRFRYFNQHELFTEAGEPLLILSPGEENTHQGPDFLAARIRLGGILLEGPVELHVRASDWLRHRHDGDVHYREVILHVVWENDLTSDVAGIPMLVLGQRVPKLLLGQYLQWMSNRGFIPCERRMRETSQTLREAWSRDLLLRRLDQKTFLIGSWLQENRQHWEETTWWLMARSMGQRANAAAFEAISRTLPLSLIARLRSDQTRLEALLLGQAGLLETVFRDEYPRRLQEEYRFCRHKYGLQASRVPVSFLRMRPGHFPSVRLAQLAAMLAGNTGWFARVLDAGTPRALMAMLDVKTTGYWDNHYTLDRESAPGPKRMGETIKKSLLINAFIPLLYAYGRLRDVPAYRKKALSWLETTGPEKNAVLLRWQRLGVEASNAAGTQALLELKKNYCDQRRCLDCRIGQALLGPPAGMPSLKPASPPRYSN